ncbi:staygreen family protein [Clostridium sp. C8-1-8]|uniref:staygreen family protein n=1 Tax=Clostridium sp. C8-1-8 TaxID=2698831 RepID=UPI00136AA510|nr:staygreen family protein [Clostridium sp. C8-1-8]
MSKLNPEKLFVEFRDGVTTVAPIIGRRYTLTHSDITAELFLTIGLNYAYDKTNSTKDEVLGEWIKKNNELYFHIYLVVSKDLNPILTAIRDYIFRKELPLAIEAIRYGDSQLFNTYPELDKSEIIVHFLSTCEHFNKVESYGPYHNYGIQEK